MENIYDKIQESANFIESKSEVKPSIGLILGSGLGVLADEIQNPVKIKYNEIPNFPVSTVEGQQEITFPVRVMKALGVNTIVVTNAAGGANTNFKPGDLMLIKDHINLSGNNPLIGKNDQRLGPRFPDMSSAYTPKYIDVVKECANKLNIELQEGVYAFFSGPTYETPAEVKMARILGADAVGMSTAPEVIVASHSGIEVIGISCITNMAAGILDQPLDHEEVIETTQKVKAEFLSLVKSVVNHI